MASLACAAVVLPLLSATAAPDIDDPVLPRFALAEDSPGKRFDVVMASFILKALSVCSPALVKTSANVVDETLDVVTRSPSRHKFA